MKTIAEKINAIQHILSLEYENNIEDAIKALEDLKKDDTLHRIIHDIEYEMKGDITYQFKSGLGLAREIIEKQFGKEPCA